MVAPLPVFFAPSLQSTDLMSLPSRHDIQIRLLALIGFSAVVFLATSYALELPPSRPASLESEANSDVAPEVNWDDVNLQTGMVDAPEATVKTLRSKMLSGFEAR